jgi:hypothetical protein
MVLSAVRIAAIALGCALLAPMANAQETRARLITEIDANAFADAFPPVALATAVSGRVVLECAVAVDGSSECRAVEETPAGAGFGAAAEGLAADWRFEPRVENGQQVASVARMPVEFQNPNEQRLVIQSRLYVSGTRPRGADTGGAFPPLFMQRATCGWNRSENCARQAMLANEADEDSPPVSLFRYYPERALREEIDGRVVIACAMRADRTLDCAVQAEVPTGQEFGQRAIQLVSDIAAQLGATIEPGAVFRVAVAFNAEGYGSPLYEHPPTWRDYDRWFPREARSRNEEGRVDLECTILPNRRLECYGGYEHPAGIGFSGAALGLASELELRRSIVGTPGYEVGERIKVPFVFAIPRR